MTLPICFACGCDWACGHREPELLLHYARVLRSIERSQAAVKMPIAGHYSPAVKPEAPK
jgi:hypothetical protein